MDIAAVADELYGLPPDQFTASRNERAKACRAGGDRELGTQVAALRKPSTAAWVVNQLARHRRDELGQLIELGAALRAAHLDLQAERLRDLSDQRHRVVAALARAGGALAAEQGHAVSDAVRQEVEQTLEAALADPAAAQAVSSGRLVSGLSYAGLGDVGAAVAAGGDQPVRRPGCPHGRPGGPGPANEHQQRLAREVAAAETAAAAATRAAEDATRQLDAASEQVRDAVRGHDEAQARVQELHDELRSAQEDVTDAASELRRVQRARVEASRRAETAAREAARARARLEALREGRDHPPPAAYD